jgi:hypothetical protein
MTQPQQHPSPERALGRIEESILPSLSLILDSLIESASLARPGVDAEGHAAELRKLALQLETLTREVEALSPSQVRPQPVAAAA